MENLSLLFELYDADGLVHAGYEEAAFVVKGIVFQQAWHEFFARVVAVHIHGKGSKGDEVDAVAFLERGQVGISQ